MLAYSGFIGKIPHYLCRSRGGVNVGKRRVCGAIPMFTCYRVVNYLHNEMRFIKNLTALQELCEAQGFWWVKLRAHRLRPSEGRSHMSWPILSADLLAGMGHDRG